MPVTAKPPAEVPVALPGTTRRWLLFVHQLPASPSNLRVRTWRRLQQLGALPVKQAVYVLPDTAAAREDFEWLKTEVKASGGDATVFAADGVDSWSDDALVEEFRRSRQDAYLSLAEEVERVIERLDATRRPRRSRKPAVGRLVEGFRARFSALERIDFFGSAGRDRVATLLSALEDQARRHAEGGSRPARCRRPHGLYRTPVGHPAASGRGPHELGVADPAIHRPGRALRLRRRP